MPHFKSKHKDAYHQLEGDTDTEKLKSFFEVKRATKPMINPILDAEEEKEPTVMINTKIKPATVNAYMGKMDLE